MAFSSLDAHTAHYVYVVVFCSVCSLQNDTHEKICLIRCHVVHRMLSKYRPRQQHVLRVPDTKNLASNYKEIVVVRQLYLLLRNSICSDHNELQIF